MMPAVKVLVFSAIFAVLVPVCGRCSACSDFELMVRTSIGEITSGDRPDPLSNVGDPAGMDRKSVARAMLLSAVLPGLGQMYAGGTRGYAVGGTMAAVDVISAWQYYDNNRKGDDRKSDYQALARDHYSRDRFVGYVRDTIVVFSGSDLFETCTVPGSYDSSACWNSIHNVFPLSDRDDAAYYEQIGDEDRFIFGWDDWDPYGTANHQDEWIDWDPYTSLPDGIPRTSARCEHYRSIKADADDYYGKADRYAWVMVIGRVVSMIDAAILVKVRNRDLAAVGSNPRLTLKAGLNGGPNFKVGLKVRF
jgi:hypothetical protein